MDEVLTKIVADVTEVARAFGSPTFLAADVIMTYNLYLGQMALADSIKRQEEYVKQQEALLAKVENARGPQVWPTTVRLDG